MAAPATRSASGGASSSSDDESRCLMLALSHDELGVIIDGLADPLQPVVAVALSSTCLGLRTPLRAAIAVLKERHAKAVALLRKAGCYDAGARDAAVHHDQGRKGLMCSEVRGFKGLNFDGNVLSYGLTVDDMATLGMLLLWLPKLRFLEIHNFGSSSHLTPIQLQGIQALCEGLGRGAVPSLEVLSLHKCDQLGLEGIEVVNGALRRGAFPKLELVGLHGCRIGIRGMAALAPTLRKLPALKILYVGGNDLGVEGFDSLMADLDKNDFKTLKGLYLHDNNLGDADCTKLIRALRAGALPMLQAMTWGRDHASEVAEEAVQVALAARKV